MCVLALRPASCDILRAMKQSISRLRAAFRLPDAALDAYEKRVVARYSRGNVKLQFGRVMSEREFARQKQRVLAYDFH